MTTSTFSHNALPPLSPHQPYTAPFLARLSLFILHAPLPIVKSTLDTATHSDKLSQVDQHSEVFQPEDFTSAMCQRILRLFNELVIMFPGTTHPSPDTIPLALCLLFRYRVALASTSPREATAKYDVLCASERVLAPVPCYVSTPVSATQLSDATLIALSVHIAYKFLADDKKWSTLQHWVRLLEANKRSTLEAEKRFLRTIDYVVWVRQEEFVHLRDAFEGLWNVVLSKTAGPAPPDFVLKRIRKFT
ncbi:unnamed protein product [Alternaria burnsii]|nr:unnamed protein product [Alternaria burnsii]